MAIDLTPGEIYFIGEVDVRTIEPSSYYKIGLVREKDDKRVDQRLLEHQTGNPRQLTLLRSIKTPCVSKVENHLHRSFATSQVSGEWFHLDSSGLNSAVSLCETLSTDAWRRISFVEASATISKEVSSGESIEPTSDQRALHQHLLTMKYGSKLCDQLGDVVMGVLDELTERGKDTSLYVTRQTKAGKKAFNEKLFLEHHPDLHAKFMVTVEKFKAGTFALADIRKFVVEPDDIDPGFGDLYRRIHDMAGIVRRGEMTVDEFYELYLAVLGHEVKFDWESNFAEAELKAQLGHHDEIIGICKWKRGMSTETKFDKAALAQEYPELVDEFTTQAEPETATVLHKGRGAIGV